MIERVLVDVRGLVQGVGFRPHVYTLATALELRGFVRNQGAHVLIDVEGESRSLETFLACLTDSAPAPARVERVDCRPAEPTHHSGFAIDVSNGSTDREVLVSPDLATCDACLDELFDPANRRYRYPFINCSHCGPRYTIVQGLPYDRERTTMAGFVMCDECQQEYNNPADRRFHAQPIACPTCGPRISLLRDGNLSVAGRDPLRIATAMLRRGWIIAVKGLGGYHLACDAQNDRAVARLRLRKSREAKPFAVMVSEKSASGLLSEPHVAAALQSAQRPIALIDRELWCATGAPRVASNVAPGCPAIGVMLPYTPLHHLLLRESGGPLVMTSGNPSGEPIVYRDEDAVQRLADVADFILMHDRPIHTRCDDSVVRVTSRATCLVRRARGHAPTPIRLSEPVPVPVLAVGGHLKNAFCLAAGRDAYMSPHIGDLDELESYRSLRAGVERYCDLLGIEPAIVAHDKHPEYASTRLAEELSSQVTVAVQHHHAHVLACAAEHGISGPVIGVAFDGAGLGDDGHIWGGEFLLVEGVTCERLAHLAYVPLAGGDRAARQPWRMAMAHAMAADVDPEHAMLDRLREQAGGKAFGAVRGLIARPQSVPRTSSMGRLFDGVAALAGVRSHADFEGQAAMELEALAAEPGGLSYTFRVTTSSQPWVIEAAPVIRDLVRDVLNQQPIARIAGSFHEAVAAMIVDVSTRLSKTSGVRSLVLTGGVFQNALLTEAVLSKLSAAPLDVFTHQRVPSNDGGLALGQALFAARLARIGTERELSACV